MDSPSNSHFTQDGQRKDLPTASSAPLQYYPAGNSVTNGVESVALSHHMKNSNSPAKVNGSYLEGMAVAEGPPPHVSQTNVRPGKVPQYCNSAVKVCRQRRINNHNFCIRHILEDSAAPYKPCEHIRKRGGKEVKCANAVPLNQETK